MNENSLIDQYEPVTVWRWLPSMEVWARVGPALNVADASLVAKLEQARIHKANEGRLCAAYEYTFSVSNRWNMRELL